MIIIVIIIIIIIIVVVAIIILLLPYLWAPLSSLHLSAFYFCWIITIQYYSGLLYSLL